MTGWLDAAAYAREWARAGDRDPYFHPAYLEAAALLEEDAEPAGYLEDGALTAFLVRPLPGGMCDLATPYGYGGPQGSGGLWRTGFRRACSERRVVSEFVRFHPLRRNHLGLDDVLVHHVQDTVTVGVAQDDAGLEAQMSSAARNSLRKARRSGVEPRRSRDLDRFRAMYHDTMARVGARESYRFPAAFFDRLDALGEGLVLLDAGCAAGLFLAGGGAMHYFLSASTDEGRRLSATNAILFEAMRVARADGLETLHLGGGLRAGDSLHRFKQSIGSGRAPFFVGSAVHDAEAYASLSDGAPEPAAGGRFPAYRR
ncbi:MAG TPA: GNAT family N-acetyltransferase [Gaiellales bacterium]|nr:GNAT family N-acetyltransferase [Gaiellales bacterium]